MSRRGCRCGQGGVALVVTLVMLVVLTMLVLSAVTISTSDLKSTANAQYRDQSLAAANVASEQVVSTDFYNSPLAFAVDVDINQDGVIDYNVTVPAPACIWWSSVDSWSLDPDDPDNQPCFVGARRGGLGGGAAESFCADTRWELRSQVRDPVSGALATVTQGIQIRMNQNLARNACQ